jgi:hypothetical protein
MVNMTRLFRFKSITHLAGIAVVSLLYTMPVTAGKLDPPSTPLSSQNNTPTSGRVIKFTRGDLMCYVDLISRGKKHHIGADFAICERTQFLNRQVKLTYKLIPVNDCKSSNQPCGKTHVKKAIVKMKLARSK